MNDNRPEIIDDIDRVIDNWIDDSMKWTNTAELMGEEAPSNIIDVTPYEELLIAFDYICQKLVPARIEHVKFLQSHTHDFQFDENENYDSRCIHCNQVGDV